MQLVFVGQIDIKVDKKASMVINKAFAVAIVRWFVVSVAMLVTLIARSQDGAGHLAPESSFRGSTDARAESTQCRPRIQVRDERKTEILAKIEQQVWARTIFRKLKQDVDRYLAMYLDDSEKFLSRMVMNRRPRVRYTHYGSYGVDAWLQNKLKERSLSESPYTEGVIGFGDAPDPTPLYWFATNVPRVNGKNVPFPRKIEEWPPETEATRPGWGFLTTHPATEQPFSYWTTDLSPIGHPVHEHYEAFFRLAKQAGFLYWLTGEEDYARMGSDIVLLFCRGAQHVDFSYNLLDRIAAEEYRREVSGKPGDLKVLKKWIDEGKACTHGSFMTRHPLFAQCFAEMALAFDFLAGYMQQQEIDTMPIERTCKKVCEAVAFSGRYEGNINWIEATSMVPCALALEGHSHYEDGRGRDFYIQYFTHNDAKYGQHAAAHLYPKDWHDNPSQSCVPSMLAMSHEPQTGLLKETFGYMDTATGMLRCLAMCESAGYPIVAKVPNALKAAYGKAFYLFPGTSNGPNYGDGHDNRLSIVSLELAYPLAIAHDLPDGKLIAHHINEHYDGKRDRIWHLYPVEQLCYCAATVEAVDASEVASAIPRVSELPYAGCIIQRNRYEEPDNAVMAVVMGAEFGHRHLDGMSLEAFAKGRIFALDGWVPAWYDSKVHQRYNNRRAAHNTVIVNTKSNGMGHVRPVHQDPQTGASLAISELCSFTDTYFDDVDTQSDQRRIVGIIRLAPTSALLVDIFRSKTRNGTDVTHDYVYHNAGDIDTITDVAGKPLSMKPSEDLSEDNLDRKWVGYDLFRPEQVESAPMPADFATVRFAFDDKDRGDRLITRMWDLGGNERTLFRVNRRPVSHEEDPNLEGKTIPDDGMIVVRQQGEAWSRPFISVFDNYLSEEGSAIRSVSSLEGVPTAGDLVALRIETDKSNLKHHVSTDSVIVLNATDVDRPYEIAQHKIAFTGAYAVVGLGGDSPYLYLGRGTLLRHNQLELKSTMGKLLSANLQVLFDGYRLTTDGQTLITLPVQKGEQIEARSLSGDDAPNVSARKASRTDDLELLEFCVPKNSKIRFRMAGQH